MVDKRRESAISLNSSTLVPTVGNVMFRTQYLRKYLSKYIAAISYAPEEIAHMLVHLMQQSSKHPSTNVLVFIVQVW